MYTRKIMLSRETVQPFVNAASRCDFHIDVSNDKMTVSAKSIMGVFSLDLTHELTVKYPEKDEHFEIVLNQLAA